MGARYFCRTAVEHTGKCGGHQTSHLTRASLLSLRRQHGLLVVTYYRSVALSITESNGVRQFTRTLTFPHLIRGYLALSDRNRRAIL